MVPKTSFAIADRRISLSRVVAHKTDLLRTAYVCQMVWQNSVSD